MNFFNVTWLKFKGTVRGFDSPRQLALGIALGMLIGLIPKDSLLPYAIGLIAILSHSNLLCLGISAFVFTKLGPLLDGLSHPLGAWALNLSAIEPSLNWLYQWPLLPWMRLENTVVTGSFIVGLLSFIPVYLVSELFFRRLGSKTYNLLIQTRAVRWLVGQPAHHLQES